MADWDADSPQLRRNLARVLASVKAEADRRVVPSVASARAWQRETMAGLSVPNPLYVGRFRGKAGLRTVAVTIGGTPGVAPGGVARALREFEARLRAVVAALDARYPSASDLDVDGLAAVIDLAAWAHSEWVRIHPFANGNGRTARIWANLILMRYGLPPAVRLRPRPDGRYGQACASAMTGEWRPTAAIFRAMVQETISAAPPKSMSP